MARRPRRIRQNGIYDTLLTSDDPFFEDFKVIFGLIDNVLKTENNENLLTEAGELLEM